MVYNLVSELKNMSQSLAVVIPAYNEGHNIPDTLAALYGQTYRSGVMHYIVDNGSTDDTIAQVQAFCDLYPDFPLTLLQEPEQGTGAACDTGFTQAIADGHMLIARTDSDTIPAPDWTGRIVTNFTTDPKLQLLGGRSKANHDKYYRIGDELIRRVGTKILDSSKCIVRADYSHLLTATGHNMATTASAYQTSGGFPRTSIAECDEDVEYSLKVLKYFGRQAVKRDPDLVVATSMRRYRKYGFGRGVLWYMFPDLRAKLCPSLHAR